MFWRIALWARLTVRALYKINLRLERIYQLMSEIRDAAVAVKDSVDALGASVDDLGVKVDAIVAALGSGSPADIQEALAALVAAKDRAVAAKASADESVSNIVDALPPSA